jgi:glycosyltransferase involved in cell wall biosynthesis
MSRDKIPETLLTCDILVNPRKSGVFAEAGFPTKLGEYFSTKKPVISTRVGDIKSYFTDKNELVLVEPDNPDQLSLAIIYLTENKSQAKRIGDNGYGWAIRNLDFKTNTKKLIDFLGSL